MDFSIYQKQAATTAQYSGGLTYAVLGLANEAGEVTGALKKHLRGDYDEEELHRRVLKELGDVLWYAAAVASELSLDLSEVAELNLQKLAIRAANGTIKSDGDNR